MAVAYDNTSSQATTTGDQTWSHGGSASAAGALVLIVEEGGTDTITSVTYGGQTMTEVTGSPLLYTTPETGSIHGFFLGNPPKGTQDVAVDTATGSDQWIGACFTVTSATGFAQVHDTSTMAGAAAQTTVGATLTITADSFVAGAMYSGLGAPAFTEVSGTTQVVEGDLGADSGGISRGTTIKTTDFSYTWTQASDDGMALVVAICELPGDTAPAECATATGAAYTSGKTIKPTAGAASGTGAAYQATGRPGTRALATVAAATGAAANAVHGIGSVAQAATGTGAGYGTTTLVVATVEATAATGTAAAGTASVGATSVIATGTSSALDATASTTAGMVNFTCQAAAAGTALALAINANLKASAGYAKARSA